MSVKLSTSAFRFILFLHVGVISYACIEKIRSMRDAILLHDKASYFFALNGNSPYQFKVESFGSFLLLYFVAH